MLEKPRFSPSSLPERLSPCIIAVSNFHRQTCARITVTYRVGSAVHLTCGRIEASFSRVFARMLAAVVVGMVAIVVVAIVVVEH